MKIYRNATLVTAFLTVFAGVAAGCLNFWTTADSFWCNLLLGVFGSGLLTFITSVIGYRVERQKTFEGFLYCTKEILHNLNKYRLSWTVEEKIDFFLTYHDISCAEWDRYFGEFCFLFDFGHKNREYIYNKIYHPILEINQRVNHHVWHFRWHKEGSGQDEHVMERFVREIEDLIIERKIDIGPSEAETSVKIRSIPISTTRNKIVGDLLYELNNEYYRLMYGNRVYKQSQAEAKK